MPEAANELHGDKKYCRHVGVSGWHMAEKRICVITWSSDSSISVDSGKIILKACKGCTSMES